MRCRSFALLACSIVMLFGDVRTAQADDFFESHIRPVLVDSCFTCHGGGKISGHLRVDSRDALLTGGESGAAIVLGKPDESLLIRAIKRHDDVSAMPPEKEKALRPDQVEAFEQWIRTGANWPTATRKFEVKQHWAFAPIEDPAVPNVVESTWPRTSVDHFIRAKMDAAHVVPAEQADKITLIRRATFDLTGLPPTPDDVANFLGDSSQMPLRKLSIDCLRRLITVNAGDDIGWMWFDMRTPPVKRRTIRFPWPGSIATM